VNELLGYFDNDNGFPDINLPARDKSLSFHWRARRSFFTDLFGSTGNPAKDDARNSVLTEAVLAYEAGQWVSYSRSHDFYSGRRYCGTAFTFHNTTGAVEWGVAQGLLEEERANPGDHLRTGRQSRFRAKPCLVEAYRGAKLRYEIHELIRMWTLPLGLVAHLRAKFWPLSHRRGRNRFITGTASPRAFAHADRDGDGSHARRPSPGRARW
jgi:hypothetical protein